MSKDLFKEAIADAKAVREAALANAKLALEEAFTPHIKEMLAAKIQEMENSELEEAENVDEMYGVESNGSDVSEEFYPETGKVEEELSLEEILAALEEAEKAEANEGKKEDELEEAKEDLDEVIDLEALLAEADKEEAEEETEEASEEEEEEVGEMTVEELKDLIRSIVGEISSGAETAEEPEMVDLDEILAERDEHVTDTTEEDDPAYTAKKAADVVGWVEEGEVDEVMMGAIPDWQFALGLLIPTVTITAGLIKTFMPEIKQAWKDRDMKKMKEIAAKVKAAASAGKGGEDVSESEITNEETLAEIEALRTELNETNLLNAKLLYSNKIFRANELNENQKLRVINAFDKASNVNEAKLIYETIKDSFTTAKEKKQIKESLGFASKPTGTATSKSQIVAQPDNTVARLQKLAGII